MGADVSELYVIPGMAHGAPLATGDGEKHCGVPGAFLLDVGISSSYHIARFWGLTKQPRKLDWIFARWRREQRSQAAASPAVARDAASHAEVAKQSGAERSLLRRSSPAAALIPLARS